METNPDELQVTEVVEPVVEQPKRAKKRVPKKALEQIERARNEQSARDTVDIEETKAAGKAQGRSNDSNGSCDTPVKVPFNQVLQCECGCNIMLQSDGLYPARCPECGTWNDFRGVKFLEQSPNILVCDKCGGLTLIKPDTVCCEHCGAR